MKECPQHMSMAAPTMAMGNLQAGAGVFWLNNNPCPPQQLKLGPQSSQYAEIAAILIILQLAASHNIKELLICTK